MGRKISPSSRLKSYIKGVCCYKNSYNKEHMTILKALGIFINYCNTQYGHDPDITNERFQKGKDRIMNSEEDTFAGCRIIADVLREINWPDI